MGTPGKYPELDGKIREKYRTQHAFASALGMHPSTLSAKLRGRSQWAFNEVATSCRLLGIPLSQADVYFFK